MTDRRKGGPNYMQRVFDALRESPELMTIADICKRTGFDDTAVKGALDRLQRPPYRVLITVCQDRRWRYGVKASAARPIDRRGGTKREVA